MTKSPFSSSSAAWKHRRIDPILDFGIGLVGLLIALTKVIRLRSITITNVAHSCLLAVVVTGFSVTQIKNPVV
jgi:hypothetical protein